VGGKARGRCKVCSAPCTRWATARAAACLLAARVCQKEKLEGLVARVIIAELRKPVDCPAVGDDVEELPKRALDPP
jgi:hypothetical protein